MAGFRRLDAQAVGLGLFDGTLDPELAGVEINVAPLQAHQLAPTHPGREEHDDLWINHGPAHRAERRLHLVGTQDFNLVGRYLWRGNQRRWVARQQLAARRVGEPLVQHPVRMPDSARSEGAALVSARAQELGVPVGDVCGLELLKRVRADMRGDLAFD